MILTKFLNITALNSHIRSSHVNTWFNSGDDSAECRGGGHCGSSKCGGTASVRGKVDALRWIGEQNRNFHHTIWFEFERFRPLNGEHPTISFHHFFRSSCIQNLGTLHFWNRPNISQYGSVPSLISSPHCQCLQGFLAPGLWYCQALANGLLGPGDVRPQHMDPQILPSVDGTLGGDHRGGGWVFLVLQMFWLDDIGFRDS